MERDGDGVLEGKEVRKKIKRKERIRKRRWKILLLKVKGRQWERLEWEREGRGGDRAKGEVLESGEGGERGEWGVKRGTRGSLSRCNFHTAELVLY